MGPRGQYRPARHLSGHPQRRREDGRAPAWRDRQCRLRCRHDVRSDPCLHGRESRRHSDHADARRRMGPQWRARQCSLAGLYAHRHAGGRYRLRSAEQEMAGKSDRDEPAGRADRGRTRHRMAAFADEQRRHRNQSTRGRRIYRRHHLGRLWRPARSAERVVEDMSMNIVVSRKKLDLSSTIAEGDIRVLLMVLVHMTGDERWLEPPYKPKRDVRLIPDPQAGMPKEIQAEIRAAALKLFANGEPKPVITDPGNELMLKMMRATLGENVAPEYAPLMREEMGFIPREARWTKSPSGEKLAQQHVLIVGAGVCAIALGVALGRLGIPYTIVEKNDELGGTWYVNRYPGCGVDTPNHSYSFSFGTRNPWTRYFAQRQELLDYLKKIALEHDIRKHLLLNTELMSSRWDESKRRWISTLKTTNGEEI